MKSSNIQKINTLGKVGDIICKIAKVCVIIGMVACLVGGLILCLIPREALHLELITESTAIMHMDTGIDISHLVDLGDMEGIITFGGSQFQITGSTEDTPLVSTVNVYLSDLKWMMFAIVIGLIPSLFLFHFGGKLCRAFKSCATPFTEEIARGFMNLAWCLIPVSLAGSVMESLADSVATGKLDIVLSVDLTIVLLVLCVFMLSYVFKHGVAIQAEVDETL